MKERYEELKMDVVVFDADIRTATADGVKEASGGDVTTGREGTAGQTLTPAG